MASMHLNWRGHTNGGGLILRACLYDPGIPACLGIPGSRLVNNLLLFLQLRLYGDRDIPLDRDPG